MEINTPQQVKDAIAKIEENEHEAYIVGGCVRDRILGLDVHDWDITTSALPDEIMEIFADYKTAETGTEHGTVTVIIDSLPLEITTYRIDGRYLDNRHPEQVTFTSKIDDDLSRRDFTINALAYNVRVGIVDLFGGIDDINKRTIRCVGEPDDRFSEDALRIMRALRFASVLEFEIEPQTARSIHRNRDLLKNISVERFQKELNGILTGAAAERILNEYRDVIAVIIPEITPMFDFDQRTKYHNLDIWRHTAKSVGESKDELEVRLTMLFHDIGKPATFSVDGQGVGHFYEHGKESTVLTKRILKRLKYPTRTIEHVSKLVKFHDAAVHPNKKSVARWMNRLSEQGMRRLLSVKRADTIAHAPEFIGRLDEIDSIEKVVDAVIEDEDCFSLKHLAVDGNDLIEIGITKGTRIGNTLGNLLDAVINQECENEREALLTLAKKINKIRQ